MERSSVFRRAEVDRLLADEDLVRDRVLRDDVLDRREPWSLTFRPSLLRRGRSAELVRECAWWLRDSSSFGRELVEGNLSIRSVVSCSGVEVKWFLVGSVVSFGALNLSIFSNAPE